jgi:hypothetical protein
MQNPFRCFNSSPEVIRLTVMMYIRYLREAACTVSAACLVTIEVEVWLGAVRTGWA